VSAAPVPGPVTWSPPPHEVSMPNDTAINIERDDVLFMLTE